MSKLTIESDNSSMLRLVLYTTAESTSLVMRIEESQAGTGEGDGVYTETVKIAGTIVFDLDDARSLMNYVERFVYAEEDRVRNLAFAPLDPSLDPVEPPRDRTRL
jgi:hypothetical protein